MHTSTVTGLCMQNANCVYRGLGETIHYLPWHVVKTDHQKTVWLLSGYLADT